MTSLNLLQLILLCLNSPSLKGLILITAC